MRHLFDHTARVNRLTEVFDDYGEATNRYVIGTDVIRCAIVPPKVRAIQTEAGTAVTGQVDAYFDADADVQMNDVIDVLTGPEAPTKLKVLSASHPRGHHTEAICEPFTRALTAAVP